MWATEGWEEAAAGPGGSWEAAAGSQDAFSRLERAGSGSGVAGFPGAPPRRGPELLPGLKGSSPGPELALEVGGERQSFCPGSSGCWRWGAPRGGAASFFPGGTGGRVHLGRVMEASLLGLLLQSPSRGEHWRHSCQFLSLPPPHRHSPIAIPPQTTMVIQALSWEAILGALSSTLQSHHTSEQTTHLPIPPISVSSYPLRSFVGGCVWRGGGNCSFETKPGCPELLHEPPKLVLGF